MEIIFFRKFNIWAIKVQYHGQETLSHPQLGAMFILEHIVTHGDIINVFLGIYDLYISLSKALHYATQFKNRITKKISVDNSGNYR